MGKEGGERYALEYAQRESGDWEIRSREAQCSQPQESKEVKKESVGNSLVVQWLRLHTFTAEGLGWIPGHETKILLAER